MSNYTWTKPSLVSYEVASRDDAPDAFNLSVAEDSTFEYPAVTEEFALYIGDNGEGVLIEGAAVELLAWVGQLYEYVAAQIP